MTNAIHTNNAEKSENNWAFIDTQNLYKGVRECGWKINWTRFREYLKSKYNVTRAFVFLGYIQEYNRLYTRFKNADFIPRFRPVRQLRNGKIDGGNVDVDLAYFVGDYKSDYHKAIIVADDGDYYNMIGSLNRQNKLKLVISSHPIKKTSELIKQAVRKEQILSIHSIRSLIE